RHVRLDATGIMAQTAPDNRGLQFCCRATLYSYRKMGRFSKQRAEPLADIVSGSASGPGGGERRLWLPCPQLPPHDPITRHRSTGAIRPFPPKSLNARLLT